MMISSLLKLPTILDAARASDLYYTKLIYKTFVIIQNAKFGSTTCGFREVLPFRLRHGASTGHQN